MINYLHSVLLIMFPRIIILVQYVVNGIVDDLQLEVNINSQVFPFDF